MSPAEFFRELVYPLRSMSILLVVFFIFAIIGFVKMVALINSWVAAAIALILCVFLMPGLMRYLMHIAESRAKGVDSGPPTTEMFGYVGNFWALSPLLALALVAMAWFWLRLQFGQNVAAISCLIGAAVFPAMLAVLLITQSAIQSVNPVAIWRLITHTGPSYWYSTVTAVVAVVLPIWLENISPLTSVVTGIFLLFAFFAVTGSILRNERLMDEVGIPDPVEPEVEQQLANLEKERTGVLNHAYGFVSRGNREGGLQHLFTWLERDPDPSAAWRWFFEQMLRWEQPEPALFFAQHYLSRLLAQQDRIAAVKLLLRCRMIDDAFRPKSEDIQEAIEAAEGTGNVELTTVLKRL